MKAKSIALFLLAAIVVLGVPVLGSKFLTWMGERELSTAEARAKSMGVPLTMNQVLADYKPGPDEKNAAEAVKEIFRQIMEPPRTGSSEFGVPFREPFKTSTNKLSESISKLFRDGNTPDWPDLRKRLAPFKETITSLHQAADRPDWNFKRPWEQGMAMLIPDAVKLKEICRVLYIHALVSAHDGDSDSAIRSAKTILRLAAHVRTEPNFILVNISGSLSQLASRTILDIARDRPLTSHEIEKFKDLFDNPSPTIDWKRLWYAEQISTLETMDLFLTKKGLLDLGVKEEDGYVPYSRRKYVGAKAKAINVLTDAYREWQTLDSSELSASQIAMTYGPRLNEIYASYSDILEKLSAGMGPTDSLISGLIQSTRRWDAQRRLTFLALQMTFQPKGSWKLPPDAVKTEWLDPFAAGKPMRLNVDSAGFKLYSVGSNATDDGGQEKDSNDDPLDIVVSFPNR